MELAEFIDRHAAVLERNQPRHNLILGLLERARSNPGHGYFLWSLDRPGACAIRTPMAWTGILLGEPTPDEAAELAIAVDGNEYPTIQGEERAAAGFVDGATLLGRTFSVKTRLRILTLEREPDRPVVPGRARPATADDAALVLGFMVGFQRDAGLTDPPPTAEGVADAVASGRYFLWETGGEPVAMAAIGRTMRDCRSIAPVYTVPERRGRGFGGAITAHVVDQIFAGGQRTACLFADAGNPAANRCYEKLGFSFVCNNVVYQRTDRSAVAG